MLPDITDINGLKFLMQMHFLYLKKKVSSIEKLPNPLEKIFSKKEVQKIRWNCINVFADMNLL